MLSIAQPWNKLGNTFGLPQFSLLRRIRYTLARTNNSERFPKMRFEFYTDALENVPKLSVDGTVPNSIHFSHWEGNQTPAEVKADTSTEIALNLVASPNKNVLTNNIVLVTNNHFDTDGVLSCWTVLNGERALEFRDLLIAAAESGDFSQNSKRDGIRVSLAIQGSDQVVPGEDSMSPLASFLSNGNEQIDEARAYELIFPEVAKLLSNIDAYEPLWRDGWNRIAQALESFERGTSNVTEIPEAKLSIVTLSPDIFEGSGFNPTKHAAPFTAISEFARGELFLIGIPTIGGWFYRVDYPYWSWAETVVRPRIARRDLSGALQLLNEMETGAGSWQTDNRELTSAIKFVRDKALAESRLKPDEVAKVLSDSATRVATTGV